MLLEIAIGDKNAIESEFGDVLFSMINYARFLKVSPSTNLFLPYGQNKIRQIHLKL